MDCMDNPRYHDYRKFIKDIKEKKYVAWNLANIINRSIGFTLVRRGKVAVRNG